MKTWKWRFTFDLTRIQCLLIGHIYLEHWVKFEDEIVDGCGRCGKVKTI